MSSRKLKCAGQLKNLGMGYYMGAMAAKSAGQPVAWITSGAPVEMLYAHGIFPFYPENYGTLCGSRRQSQELCQAAEAHGYNQDLCSYARCTLGSVLEGKGPLGPLPPPDLLVTAKNICHTVIKWWEVLARHYNCPLFVLDTPFVRGEVTPQQLDYVAGQLRELADFLERVTGRPFDLDKFRATLELADRGAALWQKVLDSRRHRPCPLTSLDMFTGMFPIVTLRGTEYCPQFYSTLLAEVQERTAAGQGEVEGEKHRLLWDNIAIWYNFGLMEHFHARGAVFVAETYTAAWGHYRFAADEADIWRTYARPYTETLLNIDLDLRYAQMARAIRDFVIDGVVLHSNRSCKTYSLGQMDLARRLQNELGVPVLLLEADMTDPRAFAEGPALTRIEAFLEMLG
ncbi:MAG: 2-hydroxyacyl-CoA dehydratase subunit D [Desulfurispora sp.]|uniref:2-hydroxyacyl-CoA dehydratase subunit D n=1 Tax=Desulfurispora sp. TaxID=3014275 RepID=UPI0040496F07